MRWFSVIFVFLAAYAAMHAYFYWKFWVAAPSGKLIRIGMAAFLLVMFVSPILIHLFDRHHHGGTADVWAVIGYVWLAMLFWSVCMFLLTDIWNLGLYLGSLSAPGAKRLLLPQAPTFLVVMGLVVLLTCWGAIEAQNIGLRQITIRTSRLPAGALPIRIAQVTDMHLGVNTGAHRLGRAISLIQQAKPDILVCTGDLIDSPLDQTRNLAAMLASVQAPLGKFAVLGNHEFYNGLGESLAFIDACGFVPLRQSDVRLNSHLLLAGVDDPAGQRSGQSRMDENAVLPQAHGDRPFTILLKHQPRAVAGSVGRFDLQLSGHAHGGQIFPFMLFVHMIYPTYRGWYDLADGAALYVSTGTGTWGPPLRLFARPEVVLITVVPAGGSPGQEQMP